MREKMAYQIDKLDKLSDLIQQYAPQEGINETSVKNVGTFKTSKKLTRTPVVDVPAIVIVVQGRKYCYMGNKIYDYNARNVLIMFFPMIRIQNIFSFQAQQSQRIIFCPTTTCGVNNKNSVAMS